MASIVRLGVLLSGGGRTLQNFIDLSEAGQLKARVVKVLSTRAGAHGLERARQHGIPTAVVRTKDYADTESFAAVTALAERMSREEFAAVLRALGRRPFDEALAVPRSAA